MQPIQITENILAYDLFLFIKQEKALVLADPHIGYEEYLSKEGILMPRFQLKEIIERTRKAIEMFKPKIIVINGDLKHEFGTISRQEWKDSFKFLDFLKEYVARIILIKGNHDTILEPIAKRKDIRLKDYIIINNILITHGHKIVEIEKNKGKKIKTIIIGHEHPAVMLKEVGRYELFKCFLKGKYKRKTLIVMPSLNLVTEGTNVLREKLLSPYLQKNIDDFEVYVVEDKIYYFGKIKQLL